jgi:hypothetical protein
MTKSLNWTACFQKGEELGKRNSSNENKDETHNSFDCSTTYYTWNDKSNFTEKMSWRVSLKNELIIAIINQIVKRQQSY